MEIGDRVKIKNLNGIHNAEYEPNNPKDMEGTIESIHNHELPYWVRWDNGIRNSYANKNLEKVEK